MRRYGPWTGRPYITLVTVLVALVAVLVLAGPLAPSGFGIANAQEDGEQVTVEGTLHYVWGDIDPELDEEDVSNEPQVFLYEEGSDNVYMLDDIVAATEEEGGPLQYNGKEVEVTGELDPETGRITVQDVELQGPEIESHHGISHKSGTQEWVTVACRFGDSTGTTPANINYFTDLREEMDDFWQEVSYEEIDVDGDEVGWYNMPENRSAYINSTTNRARLTKLALDCSSAADSDVDFTDYDGINFVFNERLGCCSWGGGITLNTDDGTKSYSTTWMATWGWQNQDVMGQEMGHGFGLPHSSGPYTSTYDSQWDVMSSGGTCNPAHPDFGCLGVHTVSFHKDALDWIPSANRYISTSNPDQEVFIERLAEPTDEDAYRMAEIRYGGPALFYTVEVRQFAGYDDQAPSEGVLIHKVNTARGDRLAQVVDDDGDGNPNDAGAQWTEGETFQNSTTDVSVFVRETTDSGAWVIINPEPPTADAGGPYTTPEGTDVTLDATGSSDPSGDDLTYAWDLDDDGDFDDATGPSTTFDKVGQDGIFNVCVEVTDDVGNTHTGCSTVTVENVAPSVSASSDAPIDEGSQVNVSGTVTDPGWLEDLSVTIDWGDGTSESLTGTVENNRPDATLSFSASHTYGDNGSFDVEICGSDDDTTTCEIISVTVDNVAPTATLDTSEVVTFGDETFFLGRLDEPQSHAASATDPGSDDLTFVWSWLDTTTYYNDGSPPADPDPSPHGTFPFTASDTADNTFDQPGVHEVAVTVTDDDGGSDQANATKLVTGDATETRTTGFWRHQYSEQGRQHYSEGELDAFLAISSHVSGVFSISDHAEARDTLHPNEPGMRAKAEAQALAAWLNFAAGGVGWNEQIDTDGDGDADRAYHDVMGEVESILQDPDATKQELERAKDLAEAINTHNSDNNDDGNGDGGGGGNP